MKNRKLFFVCIGFLCSYLTYSQQLYVSVSGNDNDPGTLVKPFLSLERAKQEAAKIKTSVTIYLLPGKHYLSAPLEFTKNNSQQLTIRNYSTTHRAVISGSKKIKFKWTPYKNGIWQAKITGDYIFDQLFVNGQLYHMARFPNYDSLARNYNGFSPDALSKKRIAGWKNPAGGFIHALHFSEWGGFSYMITGKNDTGLNTIGGYQNNRPAPMHNKIRFVENIFEELDTLREWYYNKNTSTLYVYPPKGVDLNKSLIELPQLESLIEVKGTMQSPVQNINIEGIDFCHTIRTFMKNREPLLRSDWTIYRKGTITVEGAEHIRITNCYFTSIGGNGIVFSNYNRNNEVSSCKITDAGSSGIVFVGDPRAVRSPLFQYEQYQSYDSIDKTPGPATDNYPAECLVYNTLIERIGRVEKQTTGVKISMSMSITLKNNTIDDVPRAGVDIGEGTWGGHLLEFNDIFNTVKETGDHGSFNSWGRDRFWHPDRKIMDSINVAHPELYLLDAIKPVIIRNNRFRCDHGWDIDLDDGSSNYEIYNNLCLNGGIKLREGFVRKVYNNIIINNSFHPHVWFQNSNDMFTRNIVSSSYKPIFVKYWGKNIDYNLFPDSSSLHRAQASGSDQHSTYGDPLFKDVANGDFTVGNNSPALALGFENFPLNNFGVITPSLRAAANKITIPAITYFTTLTGNEKTDFLGASVKSLNTVGERSATGMSSETGVLVLNVARSSKLYGAVEPNDVILGISGKRISNIKDLSEAAMELQFISEISLDIFRNQKESTIQVTIK